NKQKPLSDQEIVERLKVEEGMVVSRRTIAKYREQLGIPSSSKRKRFD
ncbi:MAG: RNA polymerase sigma-54 factor, partial [Bacillus sp. (in: firmicutes)]